MSTIWGLSEDILRTLKTWFLGPLGDLGGTWEENDDWLDEWLE